MRRTAFPLLALAALAIAQPLAAKKTPRAPVTAPGKYEDWNDGLIDSLEVLKTVKVSEYAAVRVEPLDTAATPLPKADANTHPIVKEVLAGVTARFITALRERLEGSGIMIAQGAIPAPEPATAAPASPDGGSAPAAAPAMPRRLMLRVKVEAMEPGSKAARFWVSFGAGSAYSTFSGELSDEQTGEVFLRFKQTRTTSGNLGYRHCMEENTDAIAEDVGDLLKIFK